jgi:hypothetical protein
MSKRFYSLKEACDADVSSDAPYIIANERLTKTGELGRYFVVFESFKDFLNVRSMHQHCHEILVSHKKIKSKYTKHGRLVFDFDIKKKMYNDEFVSPTFKEDVENVIISVIEMYFCNVSLKKLEFIWSSSAHDQKFSKHLTVKNLCFNDWIEMSKTFYKLFIRIWDFQHKWIKGSELIDMQIVRKSASLRMVGSSKIGGSVLTMDDPNHSLIDSLIRMPYKILVKKNEQFVSNDNYNKSIIDDIIEESSTKADINCANNIEEPVYDICGYQICVNSSEDEDDEEYTNKNVFISMNVGINKPQKINAKNIQYQDEVYENAFEMVSRLIPGVFKIGTASGEYLTLLRQGESMCLLSGKTHERENAFIRIVVNGMFYNIRYGCYRDCAGDKKSVSIGSMYMFKDIFYFNYLPQFNPERISKVEKRRQASKKKYEELGEFIKSLDGPNNFIYTSIEHSK